MSGILLTRMSGTLLDRFELMRRRYMMLQKVATVLRLQLASNYSRHLYSIAQRSLGSSTTILVDLVITGSLIALEILDLFLRHQTSDHVRLDLLELEAETLMRVIFFICLILLVSTVYNSER